MNGTIDAHVSKSTGNVVTVRNIALGNYALSPLTGLPVNLNKFEFLRLPCLHSIFATFYGIAAPQGGQIILSYKSRTMKLVDSHSHNNLTDRMLAIMVDLSHEHTAEGQFSNSEYHHLSLLCFPC